MKKPRSIIVVGSSGNGKTTLVNGLRHHEADFAFPKRYITRPQRKSDDLVENKHVTHDDFKQFLQDGHLEVAWQRPLGKDRYERYGFEVVAPDQRKIVVYSANNALLRDKTAILPDSFFDDCFIVLMKADDDIRRQRMLQRSPDIVGEELDVRVRDNGLDLVSKADLVIDSGEFKPDEVVDLVLRKL